MTDEGNTQLYKREAATTLRALRQQVRWKPRKDSTHLEKRKALGHLSLETTGADYNSLIRTLIEEEHHHVYLYSFDSERYYAVRGNLRGKEWLVIATKTGVIETAFPPSAVEDYLTKRGFVRLGTIQEVLT